jgi:hypothetical protein
VPPCSRRTRGQREWLRAVLAAIEAEPWYGCRKAHYAAIAARLMLHMDWRARTAWPTHEVLRGPHEPGCEGPHRAGCRRERDHCGGCGERCGCPGRISSDTVGRAVAWFQAAGLLGLVCPGTTPVIRAHVLHGHEGNLAAVYVCTVPRKRSRQLPAPDAGYSESADLSHSRRESDKAPRGREASPKIKPEKPVKPGKARAPRGQPVLPRPGPAPLAAVPKNRSEALAAAQAMQERIGLLRRLSAEHLRHLARPFWAAGWLPRDVLRAIDYAPDGRQHGYSAEVRSPAGWVRARLAAWLGPDGAPLPSHHQQLAAAADRHRAYLAGRRAADPAAAVRADELREAYAADRAAAESVGAEDQAAAAELLARIRAGRSDRPGDARRAEAAPASAAADPDDERWRAAVAAAVRAVAEQETAGHAQAPPPGQNRNR